jgi:methylenetetrahydrofolate dehydrogenase (NADP+)/methenyltetrahydrofolate cyclohydrolase
VAQRLDGKRIAGDIQADVAAKVAALKARGIQPKLAVVLVGDNPASASYVRGKRRVAEQVGIESDLIHLPETVEEETLLAEIERLNNDASVDGILVQLPLPSHIREADVIERVDPQKDVDGFHPWNTGRQVAGLDTVWPCTPAGVMEMLRRERIPVAGRHAVVVGRSQIVGKPMAMLLLNEHATVTVCHSRTQGLADITRTADILVVAAGRPRLIGADHVKPGAIVIDVGINRVDGKIVGDVAFDEVEPVAGAITPVPGGVGPLTIAMLMANTVSLCERRRGLRGEAQ